MTETTYPKWFRDCMTTQAEAMKAAIKSGTTIASGFATSEPHNFYSALWDFIRQEDLTDITTLQALFMAPHKLNIGDALSASGMLDGVADKVKGISLLNNLARRANTITAKIDGLSKLIEHYRELRERRIRFISAFVGPTQNMVIPSNPLVKLMFPEFVGRNSTRMGITDMHMTHFPDAVASMTYDDEGKTIVDAFVLVMTPPDENGEMSHGPANGATAEFLEMALKEDKVRIILYVNKGYPFTWGAHDSRNTVHIDEFAGPAKQGRLWIVEDDGKIPALPPHSFDNPVPTESAIAQNVVNHMELHKELTYGRAIQVGIGGTGVLAIKALRESSWTGRSYTEMLEPFTLDLFEAGKIAGSHYIEKNGMRTQLDGKVVCTFTLAEENSDFYKRLDRNPAIVLASAARVVVQEGFYQGLGINNILGIDFQGHVNSGGREMNHYSGIGGAATIVRGLGRGGVSYLCLKSTHSTPEGKRRSSIFPTIPAGTPLSMIGPDLMATREGGKIFLVTENGVAQISGKTQSNFIKEIIKVAHPDYRDWLVAEAHRHFRVEI